MIVHKAFIVLNDACPSSEDGIQQWKAAARSTIMESLIDEQMSYAKKAKTVSEMMKNLTDAFAKTSCKYQSSLIKALRHLNIPTKQDCETNCNQII